MAMDLEETAELLAEAIADEFEDTTVRPITVRLISNLLLDLPLSPAQRNDFGVDTVDHYRALRAVLEADGVSGVRVRHDLRRRGEELDEAMCSGEALTNLVKKYAPQYQFLRFETAWDELKL